MHDLQLLGSFHTSPSLPGPLPCPQRGRGPRLQIPNLPTETCSPRGPLCGLPSSRRVHPCTCTHFCRHSTCTLYIRRPGSMGFAAGRDYLILLMCFRPHLGELWERTSGGKTHLDASGDNCIHSLRTYPRYHSVTTKDSGALWMPCSVLTSNTTTKVLSANNSWGTHHIQTGEGRNEGQVLSSSCMSTTTVMQRRQYLPARSSMQ
ncbi:hypothetical protein V8C37DRAFT_251307 [Trichoderma ceciliae]